MDKATEQFVLSIIDRVKDLTLATVRPDGYPQATTVSFSNDGLTLYVGIGKHSQKAVNIGRNNKVSLALCTDYQDWNQIKGLSMGGTAEIITDAAESAHAAACLARRFPQVADLATSGMAAEVLFLKITPQVVSILNYEKGFGHTELVVV